eukprot:scaffold134969_cov36-Tisochrysis_lutea.AAC.1
MIPQRSKNSRWVVWRSWTEGQRRLLLRHLNTLIPIAHPLHRRPHAHCNAHSRGGCATHTNRGADRAARLVAQRRRAPRAHRVTAVCAGVKSRRPALQAARCARARARSTRCAEPHRCCLPVPV